MNKGFDTKLADHRGFECFEGSLRDPGLFIGALPFWLELLSFWICTLLSIVKTKEHNTLETGSLAILR